MLVMGDFRIVPQKHRKKLTLVIIYNISPFLVGVRFQNGLSKAKSSRGTFCSVSGKRGVHKNWASAGNFQFKSKRFKHRARLENDIFAAGYVFSYFIKRGIHPFGERNDESIENNIVNEKPINFKCKCKSIGRIITNNKVAIV